MTIILRTLSVVILSALLLLQTGCLLVAAGAATGATVAYVSGDLHASVDAPPQRVADAAKRAMESLTINVISAQSSSVDARVVGRTARDTKLTVSAKSFSAKSSQVSIRAGHFGDDALQARLLEEIHAQLKSTTAAESPSTQPALAGEQH